MCKKHLDSYNLIELFLQFLNNIQIAIVKSRVDQGKDKGQNALDRPLLIREDHS